MTEERRTQLSVAVDGTAAESGFEQIKQGAKSMAQAVSAQSDTAAKGVDAIGNKAQTSAQKVERAERSIIASIQRRTAALEAAGKGERAYQEALISSRGYDPARFAPFLNQLDAAVKKQEQARLSIAGYGVSAAQTAAALRGVPAQFTDIVTALQGGQAPLTVFLQQGGQLKDMFGGAGAAAKALGGYVLGLINPITIAAAAAAALGYAYYKGSGEADEFNKQLILTGRIAGVTSEQLMDQARAVGLVSGTQGEAAEVLAQLVGTGRVARDSLQAAGTAIIGFSKASGAEVKNLVKEFAELGKSPSESIYKLNEQYNFLTATTYQQIVALEQQGRKEDAAALAQKSYADAIRVRTEELTENLGYMERAWKGVAGAASGAWDAIKDVGRPDTTSEQIKALEEKLASIQRMKKFNRSIFGDLFPDPGKSVPEQAIEATLGSLRAKMARDAAKAESDRIRQLNENAAIEAAKAIEEQRKALMTGAQKVESELKAYRDRIAAIRLVTPNSPLLDPKQIASDEAAIREKGVDKAAARQGNKEATEAQRALEKYRNLVGDLNNESSGLSAGFNEQVKQLQAGWRLSGDAVEVYDRAYGLLLAKQPFAIKAQKELAEAEKQYQEERKKRFQEIEKQYEQEVNAAERSAQSVVDRVESMKDEASALERSRLLNISVAQALEDVRIARLEDVRAQAAQAGNQEVVDAINKEIAARKELTGLIARKEYEKAAEDGAKKAADEWQRTSDKIETSITDALMRGFESGKGFIENLRDTAVNMFNTLVLRPVIQATVSPIAGALTGNYSSAAGGSSLLNAASGAQSLYGLATGGATASLANLIGGAGSLFGSQALSSFATGMKGASLASGLAGPTTAGAGGLTGLGASFATAMPYVAAAALAYQVLDSLGAFKGASYHTGSAIGINADGSSTGRLANQSTFRDQRVWGGFTEVDRSGGAIYADPLTQVGQSIVGAINSTLTTFGRAAGVSAFAAFGADGSDDSEGVLRIYGSNGEVLAANSRRKYSSNAQQGFQEYMSEAGKVARDALIASDIPGWAKDILNSLGASPDLTAVTQSIATINQTQSTLQTISKTMAQFAGLTDDATGSLLTLFGGIDKITESTQSFVQNYYTDQEKIDLSTRNMKAALDAVNLALPTTKAGFRALAESLDLNTESGRKAYVTLMGISTEFASTTDAVAKLADEVTASIKEMTSGIEQEIARIKGLSASGTTKSVAQLQADFAINTAQARAGDQAAIDLLPSISQALLEAAEATAGSSLDVAIIQAQTLASLQATLDAISDPTKRLKGYASGGDFGGGWRIVGERGSELEATGPARIFSADQTARILSAGQQDSQAAAEVRELRRELAALRDDQRVQTAVLAANTGRTARILEAVTPDGTSLATTAA